MIISITQSDTPIEPKKCSCGVIHQCVPKGAKKSDLGVFWQCECETTLFLSEPDFKKAIIDKIKESLRNDENERVAKILTED